VPADDLDTAVDDWASRLAAKPELAIHMVKTQMRSLARLAGLGDTTEGDGDAFVVALTAASTRYGRPRSAEPEPPSS
jgi:enoyl-CoA hydratase/carnithine racemase